MALIRCKECRRLVSIQADPCPQCGIPQPWKSFEEEQIEQQIEKWQKEEDRQERLYLEAGKRTSYGGGIKK